MILEIKLKNIGPFKEGSTFSMVPTSYGGKAENYTEDGRGKSVLKVGIIYGANASGKTNFIYALYRLRDALRNPMAWNASGNLSYLYNPFLLDTETMDSPSYISLHFSMGNGEFRYSIEYNKVEFLSEQLEEKDGNEWILVYRREGKNKSRHEVTYFKYVDSGVPKFTTVARNQLVLSMYLPYVNQNDPICDVAQYIANIQIANGYHEKMHNLLWEEVKNWINADRKIRGAKLQRFLSVLDINIDGFTIPQKEDAPFNKITTRHHLYQNGKEIGKWIEFPINLESQGTKWLLLMGAKVIEALDMGYPLFVDEMDACYHVQATKFIISMFKNKRVNPKGAQLIMTTHNLYLMDESAMRSDQIVLVQKDKNGVSEMYALSDFNGITENTPFASWYLANRFGAIPNIGSLYGLFDDIEE